MMDFSIARLDHQTSQQHFRFCRRLWGDELCEKSVVPVEKQPERREATFGVTQIIQWYHWIIIYYNHKTHMIIIKPIILVDEPLQWL